MEKFTVLLCQSLVGSLCHLSHSWFGGVQAINCTWQPTFLMAVAIMLQSQIQQCAFPFFLPFCFLKIQEYNCFLVPLASVISTISAAQTSLQLLPWKHFLRSSALYLRQPTLACLASIKVQALISSRAPRHERDRLF